MQGVGSDDIVGLEGSIPEGHGRGSGIEDEGGAWPTGAKGVRKIQSGCQMTTWGFVEHITHHPHTHHVHMAHMHANAACVC